jgi:hypothetical protein
MLKKNILLKNTIYRVIKKKFSDKMFSFIANEINTGEGGGGKKNK